MQQDEEATRDPQGVRGHRVQNLRDERKAAQKRTFTRWMNVLLQRRDPPAEVHDLFADIQDGKVLMALLEELSGCKLLYRFRSSPHRIFRLNNISKALAFLDDRHVKLLGIDAPGIADGDPSVVLNLLWNIILHFQVKEVTGGLHKHLSSSLSSLSMSSYPSSDDLSPQPSDAGGYSCDTPPAKGSKTTKEPRYHGKAIKTLLRWVQRCTTKFGVEVHDFGKSWRSGLAFLALIKSINPALVDLREHMSREPIENIRRAFTIAHRSLDIPPLLEPEDVAGISPDEQSVITYVSTFLEHYSGVDEDLVTDIDADVPEIPNFGSVEPVSLGETLADDPTAQRLLKRLERSNEQELWKRWARRSSGGSCSGASRHCQGITEQAGGNPQASAKKGRRVLQPPSPLDAAVVSQEIQRWLERGCGHQGHGKPGGHGGHHSLSSEEGIYSLTALDSDEEDAYSYILDLNKDVFQPSNQLKRQVPRVEEETPEEMMLNQQGPQHPEVSEMFNGSGCKHRGGSSERNVHLVPSGEVDAFSTAHRKSDVGPNESAAGDAANNGATPDTAPAGESRIDGKSKEGRVVTGWSNAFVEEGMGVDQMENTRALKNRDNETGFLLAEDFSHEKEKEKHGRAKEKIAQVADDEESGTGREKDPEMRHRKMGKEEKAVDLAIRNVCATSEKAVGEVGGAGVDARGTKQDDGAEKEEGARRSRDTTEREIMQDRSEDTKGGQNGRHGDKDADVPPLAPRSSSSRGVGPPPASRGVAPSELELLLALWILLYCCLILPQMNL